MKNPIVKRLTPEEKELEKKRAELTALEDNLAERELFLATLHAKLFAFERRYLSIVGRKYAELDQIEAEIAEEMARLHPKNKTAQEEAASAREKADESARETGDIDKESAKRREFKPSENLKKLYREAAKSLHPDLANEESEKAKRHKLMAELNKAYSEGDVERIKTILRDWEASPERVKGEGTGAELVRAIRKIAQIENRLQAIEDEIVVLQKSDLFKLKKQIDDAISEGRDLMAEMTKIVAQDIASARQHLNEIKKKFRK